MDEQGSEFLGKDAPFRKCRACSAVRVRSDFRSDSREPDGVDRVCLECRDNYEHRRLIASADEKKRNMLRVISGRINGARNTVHLGEVAETMARQWGSVEGFCAFFAQQIAAAAEKKPGGMAALSGCKAVLNLFRAANQLYPPQKDLEVMASEDIERELGRTLAPLLAAELEDPEAPDTGSEEVDYG